MNPQSPEGQQPGPGPVMPTPQNGSVEESQVRQLASVPEAVAPMGSPLQQQAVLTPTQAANEPQKQAAAKNQPVRNPNTSQNALLITEIRDGMAIMNDGSMRSVVACLSINFDLMSSREREAIEYAYQSFLNSLYFPIQIIIRSQRVDIGPYLERLNKMRRDQDNMLLGVLMDDYINFIDTISAEINIMDKSFFIVMPYYPTGDLTSAVNTSKNLLSNLFAPQKQSVVRIEETTYQKAKDEMQNRVSTVINGLMQMGIQASRLDTKQLSELYYNVYNPDTAVREPLGNFDPTPAIVVRKGTGEAPQPHLEKENL
ncbi:MAG TPA: hypothetical protein VFZ58_03140 [Candidatus Saccharimonadales bacterium]